MKLKKYGAIGMMEWQVDFKVGKATVHVEFRGGFENKYGIHPATFSTKDPIVQSVIERSPFFASGRISLLDTKDLGLSAEEIAAEKQKAKKIAEQSGLGSNKPVDTQLDGQQQESVEEPAEEEDNDSEGDADTNPENDDTQSDDVVDEGMKVVKCTCNDDAKQYLLDNFSDIAVRNLRSRDIMIQVGKEHGVLFEFE